MIGSSSAVHAIVTPGCLDPRSFGAVPDDGLDDRAALQATVDAAIASGANVCIPAGTFHLSRTPLMGASNVGSLKIRGKVSITGEGQEITRLSMLGSGILPGRVAPGEWRLIDVRDGASDVYIGWMTLDGSQRFDTEEQTHLLHFTGPVGSATAEHLRITLPVLAKPQGSVPCPPGSPSGAVCDVKGRIIGYFQGGDCIRMLGGAGALVQNVTIRDVEAPNCDRSAFGLQRGLANILIEDSHGTSRDDQALDFEPTGGVGIDNVTIRRVALDHGGIDGGLVAAVGGDGPATANNVLLEDVSISNGGLFVIDTTGLVLNNVQVDSGRVSQSTLEVTKRAVGMRILNSTFIRPFGAPVGPVIYIQHRSGIAPTDVVFDGGFISQGTANAFFDLGSLRNLTVNGTHLEYAAPIAAPAKAAVVQSRGIVASVDMLAFNNIDLQAPLSSFEGFMQLSAYALPDGSGYSKGRAVITGSRIFGLKKYAVWYGGGISSPLPPIIKANVFKPMVPVLCQGQGCY